MKTGARKDLGQFWTPDWVAKAMVAYASDIAAGSMLDPAVGLGVFPSWAKRLGLPLDFHGVEKDPLVLNSITDTDIRARVLLGDFITADFEAKYDFIVANPPYLRHHALPAELKDYMDAQSRKALGFGIDRRAGIHVHFLLKSLLLLKPGGKLTFIVPADVFEGVFARELWGWIADRYHIRAVTTFSPDASPFPELDINPVVVFIQRDAPTNNLIWSHITAPGSDDFYRFVKSGFLDTGGSIQTLQRTVREAVATGLSRPPRPPKEYVPLADFAYVRRGIATGANSFFLLTAEQLRNLNIGEEFIRPVVPKTRYLNGLTFTKKDFRLLADQGKPVFLFAPDGRPIDQYPDPVQDYLRRGEKIGLPKRALIGKRRPWYKMESREPPDFFFAYLGRRNVRFVRNLSGALPLTTLLAVYSRTRDEGFLHELHKILNHPDVISQLVYVAKSYGRGALKAEPRQLESLPIPLDFAEPLLVQPALF